MLLVYSFSLFYLLFHENVNPFPKQPEDTRRAAVTSVIQSMQCMANDWEALIEHNILSLKSGSFFALADSTGRVWRYLSLGASGIPSHSRDPVSLCKI